MSLNTLSHTKVAKEYKEIKALPPSLFLFCSFRFFFLSFFQGIRLSKKANQSDYCTQPFRNQIDISNFIQQIKNPYRYCEALKMNFGTRPDLLERPVSFQIAFKLLLNRMSNTKYDYVFQCLIGEEALWW